MDRVFRTSPYKEVAVLVCHIIEVGAHRHIFAFRHRAMVGHVSSQPHAVIETLLAVTLVLEGADGA